MDDVYQLGPLIDRCRGGDPAALNELLARLRPYLRLLIRPQVGPALGRKLDASDLVQVALWHIARNFAQFRGPDVPHLLAWVEEIARNVVLSSDRYFTAAVRDFKRESPGVEAVGLPDRAVPPEAELQRAQQTARLAAAMGRLPAHYRELIEARFFDRVPFADLEARFGKSSGALRIMCLRAIERLREEMGAAS